MRGLLAARRAGASAWRTTTENAWATLAIAAYAAAFEAQPADYVARAWVGPTCVASSRFVGHSRGTARRVVGVPALLAGAAPGASPPHHPRAMLLVQRSGPSQQGMLYLRLSLRTLSTALPTAPVDRGFALRRCYEGEPAALRRLSAAATGSAAPRAWRATGGTQLWVSLRLRTTARRSFVALTDRLPAGLEFVHPHASDRVTGNIEGVQEGLGYGYGSSSASEVVRTRDTFSVFWDSLEEGERVIRYRVAVVVPGLFLAPAASVEEMYTPETLGRSLADILVVE